jgi:hypothetical protein
MTDLVAFVEAKAADLRKKSSVRLEMAATWRSGTAAENEDARRMAERMMGRKIPRKSKAEREQLALIDERIAEKHRAEAGIYDAIALALRRAHRDAPAEIHKQKLSITDSPNQSRPTAMSVPDSGISPKRWICKQCGKARRRRECLSCGNVVPLTDEQPTSYLIR